MTVDPNLAAAKQLQKVLEDAKDAVDAAFAVASNDANFVAIAHKYFHAVVEQGHSIAALKLVATANSQRNKSSEDDHDGHAH